MADQGVAMPLGRQPLSSSLSDAIFECVRSGDVLRLGVLLGQVRDDIDLSRQSDDRGRSLLLLACGEYGNVDILSLLLRPSTTLPTEPETQQQILVAAAVHGNEAVIALLLSRLGVSISAEALCSALQKAVAKGHLAVCRIILSVSGTAANLVDTSCALHVAIEHNRVEVVSTLLEHGSNANIKREGQPALVAACNYGRVEIVELLLNSKGIDVNLESTSTDGGTALYCACNISATIGSAVAIQIVTLLLEVPAVDVNLVERACGRGPLFAAAWSGNAKLCELLLQHQPHIATKFIDDDEEEEEEDEEEDEGEEDGGEPRPMRRAVACNVNKASYDGETALMAATQRGHIDVVRCLVSREETDVNLSSVFGATALSIASRKNLPEIVSLIASSKSIDWKKHRGAWTAAPNDHIRDLLRDAAGSAVHGDEAGCADSPALWNFAAALFLSPQKNKK